MEMEAQTPSDRAIEVTVRIVNHQKNGKPSYGTGFFYCYENLLFLVTNKHVLANAQEIEFKVFTHDENGNIDYRVMETITLDEDDLIRYSHGHNSKDVDIQIVCLNAFLRRPKIIRKGFYIRAIGSVDFPNQKTIENLFAIENIVFIGYPNAMWDEVNHLPIMRTGTTASLLTKDYNGKPFFLIDASVFPGSSGSPVFIINNGFFTDRTGSHANHRLIFLGVLSNVFFQPDDCKIKIVPIPTSMMPVATFKQMIDLGVVMHARTVNETIEQCIDRFKLIMAREPDFGL